MRTLPLTDGRKNIIWIPTESFRGIVNWNVRVCAISFLKWSIFLTRIFIFSVKQHFIVNTNCYLDRSQFTKMDETLVIFQIMQCISFKISLIFVLATCGNFETFISVIYVILNLFALISLLVQKIYKLLIKR